jgi:hypothetical protein
MGFLFSREEFPPPDTFLLVLGLTSSGKTHFLDMFHFGADTTKRPTIGFYETRYENYILREIGGSMDWKNIVKSFDQIDGFVFIIDTSASDESIMQSRNLMLGACSLRDNLPVIVLLNKKNPHVNMDYKKVTELLQLSFLGQYRKVLALELNFETQEWQEKILKALKWIK